MTVQEAVDKVRGIQADLDAGRINVPYPPEIRKTLFACGGVFMSYATDSNKARELVAWLNAPEPVDTELPW